MTNSFLTKINIRLSDKEHLSTSNKYWFYKETHTAKYYAYDRKTYKNYLVNYNTQLVPVARHKLENTRTVTWHVEGGERMNH